MHKTSSGSGFSSRSPRSAAALALVLCLGVVLGGTAGVSSAAESAATLPVLPAADEAVTRSCPCSGPAVGGIWRNHGQYLSCVTRAARRHARTTARGAGEARRIVNERRGSSCGTTSPDPGNLRVCAKNPVLPCRTVQSARADDCAECSAALAGKLVHCARIAGGSGRLADVCGTTARIRPLVGHVLEQRTGVDCASCEAKLGKPQAEGTDCVVARCDSFGG